jgi:hypothetical protein
VPDADVMAKVAEALSPIKVKVVEALSEYNRLASPLSENEPGYGPLATPVMA